MFKNVNCSYWVDDCNYSVDIDDGTITCTKIERGETVEETETFEEFLTGFPFYMKPSDAEFIAGWYPEIIYSAAEHWKYYPYSWMTFNVINEGELDDYLDGMSEDEYNETRGMIIHDVGLSGVFVCGE